MDAPLRTFRPLLVPLAVAPHILAGYTGRPDPRAFRSIERCAPRIITFGQACGKPASAQAMERAV